MLHSLSYRLLPLLQLTRMALVFTAVSNSLCTLLLAARSRAGEGSVMGVLDWREGVLAALISIGLYGFGMSLNDIIDRRRDRQLAAHRPLPSGRIGVVAAHMICGGLIVLAIGAAAAYASLAEAGWTSLLLTLWTAFLIAFYDLAGKYLVAPGLLTLGLIRFFHAVIPAPEMPLLWHPLLLFTHVAILSAVAYWWEEKRPTLTPAHWWAVAGGVAGIDVLAILLWWRFHEVPPFAGALADGRLWLLVVAACAFVGLGWWIRRRSGTTREAGQRLMLSGLLWLIIYDSLFVGAYVGTGYALGLFLLLPVSYLLVQVMRWWSRLVLLSQPPTFKRVRSGAEAGMRDG